MARRPSTAAPVSLAESQLAPKKRPAQQRSVETYERLLAVTAELLAEVGVERLSTNLVCQRAGLSPPALYRYFPNKYALLHALGERLMQAQNALIGKWLTPEVLAEPDAQLHTQLVGLFLDTHRVTTQSTAGIWVTRALRAIPALEAVRVASHNTVTDELQQAIRALHPEVDGRRLRIHIRMAVEVMYAAMEMLFDDPTLSRRAVADSTAWVVYDLFRRLGLAPDA